MALKYFQNGKNKGLQEITPSQTEREHWKIIKVTSQLFENYLKYYTMNTLQD